MEDNLKKQKLEKKLHDIYLKEIKGGQIRSKVKWIEEGERSRKYFLNLEKKHQSANVFEQLKTENGIVYDDMAILQECCKFYN